MSSGAVAAATVRSTTAVVPRITHGVPPLPLLATAQMDARQGEAPGASEPPEGARGPFSFHRMLAYRWNLHGGTVRLHTELSCRRLRCEASCPTLRRRERYAELLYRLAASAPPRSRADSPITSTDLRRQPSRRGSTPGSPPPASASTAPPTATTPPAVTAAPDAAWRRAVSAAAGEALLGSPLVPRLAVTSATLRGVLAEPAAQHAQQAGPHMAAGLLRWALGRGGAGPAPGGAAAAKGARAAATEPVQLDLELEGANLQYCRSVSVRLVRSGTGGAGGTDEPAGAEASRTRAGATPSTAAAAAVQSVEVPCEVVQVLYSQPYSPEETNPPPLHPVSLLRNTLHQLTGSLVRRYWRAPPHAHAQGDAASPPWADASGPSSPSPVGSLAASGRAFGLGPWRRWARGRARPQPGVPSLAGRRTSGVPPSSALVAAEGDTSGGAAWTWPAALGGARAEPGGAEPSRADSAWSFGTPAASPQRRRSRGGVSGGGAEVPAEAAPPLPSRLLLRVTLPRALAAGLLDGGVRGAHLVVSARSDFHCVEVRGEGRECERESRVAGVRTGLNPRAVSQRDAKGGRAAHECSVAL
jgi:hypothetical protein